MTTAPAYDNSVRIGYARVSTRAQEHQAQLDALAAAHCREIITETASTRGDRPKLHEALGQLQAGDTLVIYKPDRVARSMKELLVLAVARARQSRGESVTAIARHLKIGRSTLYRALQPPERDPAPAAVESPW